MGAIELSKMDNISPQTFDYRKIKRPLENLISTMENMIERQWPKKYQHLGGARTIFFMWMKITKITFNTIIYVSRDKLETDLSKLELCLSIPALTRIIYDTLFNVIYMAEDIENRSISFWKSGYKDVIESEKTDEKYFKDISKETEKFDILHINKTEILKMHKKLANISEEEDRNLKNIRSWPLNKNIIEKIRSPNAKSFLTFLYECYQRRLGAHAHLSWVGLAERAFFFSEEIDHEKLRTILKIYKSNWLFLSLSFLVALMSELNNILDFGHEQDLQNLWFIIKDCFPEANKLYDLRYSKLLTINRQGHKV